MNRVLTLIESAIHDSLQIQESNGLSVLSASNENYFKKLEWSVDLGCNVRVFSLDLDSLTKPGPRRAAQRPDIAMPLACILPRLDSRHGK